MTMSSKRAGRPIIKRARETLLRDIQHIANIKTAVLTDDTIEREIAGRISDKVDELTGVLIELLRTRE
jgi:hypothetical protein